MSLNISFLQKLNPYVIHCFHNAISLKFEKGFKYQPRTVYTYELEYINYGEGGMVLNGKIIDVREGDIIFNTPGTAIQGIARYSSVIILFAPIYSPGLENDYPVQLEIHNNVGCRMMEIIPEFRLPQIHHPLDGSEFNTLFSNFYGNFLHKSDLYKLDAKISLLRIIRLLLETAVPPSVNHNDPDSKYFTNIKQAEEYIRQNFRLQLYVSDIAAGYDMSVGFFTKLFKKYLGQTPIQYQINCRMEKAKELLFYTSKTVKEISYKCGFNTDKYFETLFTRLEGKSPTQYRKEQTDKYSNCCHQ